MPMSYHLVFILFWIAQIAFGVLCISGPLTASNLSSSQKISQDWLLRIIMSGLMITPLLYFSAICESRWRYMKYILLFPFGFIPGMSAILKSFWLCLISPAFLVLAIVTTVVFFSTSNGFGKDSIPPTKNTLVRAVMTRHSNLIVELSRDRSTLEERDSTKQTPLIIAAKTDQFTVAEILLNAGADPFAVDQFGWTAGYALQTSKLKRGPEFEARERVAKALRSKAYPIPGPDTDEILELVKAGKWPPAEWKVVRD